MIRNRAFCCVAAICVVVAMSHEGFSDDWPQFLGPTADGKSSETGLITPWPAAGPEIIWAKRLVESYSLGTVANGKYFQSDFVNGKAVLYCLDALTGEQIWTFEYPSVYRDLLGYNRGSRTSPVVDGDRVYVFGVEGKLHCLSVGDGELVWAMDVNKRFDVVQNFFGVGSTPVVYEDLLIVQVGGSPKDDLSLPPGWLDRVSGNGTGIVAFDKMTGEVRYNVTDELASYSSPRIVIRDDRPWCFVFARGGLVGFDPRNGKVDFQYPWRASIRDSVNASNPVVVGDEVFISETYGPGSSLLRFRTGGYDVVWKDVDNPRRKLMQTHWNTAIHHDGVLYGSSGRHERNAELRCIDWKTGKVRWTKPGLTRSSLLYADGHFICLSEDGTLRLLRANSEKYDVVSTVVYREADLLNAKTGRESSPRLLKPPAWAAPILADGLMYVRGDDYVVCARVMK